MNVAELIAELQKMPPDAIVYTHADGALRGYVDIVYLTRTGNVGLASEGEVVYYTEDRPADAPSEKEKQNWSLPSTKGIKRHDKHPECLDWYPCALCEREEQGK